MNKTTLGFRSPRGSGSNAKSLCALIFHTRLQAGRRASYQQRGCRQWRPIENTWVFPYTDTQAYLCPGSSAAKKVAPEHGSLSEVLITGLLAIVREHGTEAGLERDIRGYMLCVFSHLPMSTIMPMNPGPPPVKHVAARLLDKSLHPLWKQQLAVKSTWVFAKLNTL